MSKILIILKSTFLSSIPRSGFTTGNLDLAINQLSGLPDCLQEQHPSVECLAKYLLTLMPLKCSVSKQIVSHSVVTQFKSCDEISHFRSVKPDALQLPVPLNALTLRLWKLQGGHLCQSPEEWINSSHPTLRHELWFVSPTITSLVSP